MSYIREGQKRERVWVCKILLVLVVALGVGYHRLNAKQFIFHQADPTNRHIGMGALEVA